MATSGTLQAAKNDANGIYRITMQYQ